MKRDMELMRKILFYIEENYDARIGRVKHINYVDDIDKHIILEHVILLEEAGLIRKIDRHEKGTYSAGNLTNKGYEYLELIRKDDVWKRTNEEVEKKSLPNTIENIAIIAASITGAFLREFTK